MVSSPQKMKKTNKTLRYIILDTNIWQHLGNETLYPSIIEVLKDAISKNYGISLSQFSILELVDNANVEKEAKRLQVIKGVKQFRVKQNVLLVAGHLGSLYKEDGISDSQQPEKGDKIIGATAIANNCLIYTTNGKDFPPPYFKEINRHFLQYKKNGRDVLMMGYFLEPDLNVIIGRYNFRTNNKDGASIVPAVEDTEFKLQG